MFGHNGRQRTGKFDNRFASGANRKFNNLSEQDANFIDARNNLTIDQQMKMFPPMVNTLFLEKEVEANVTNGRHR